MSGNGWCVWVTGLPGSGKSVVSRMLLELLKEKGVDAQLLSSDALREVLTPRPTYSLKERDMVYAMLVYIAELLTQNGVNVVIDATGNLRRYRDEVRKCVPNFTEAYLECSLEVCMEREAKRKETHKAPKQIYAKAKKGKAPTVPGIGQPYEQPLAPEITINSAQNTPEKAAKKILNTIFEPLRQQNKA
jgi:adenylylsulfate kinase